MKILLLASHHGDEHLGEKLYAHVKKHRRELLHHVEYLLANPRARKQNVRYIESDMNRSYTGGRGTYEERRAAKVLRYINENDFDLVLDLHTATCKQPPSLIMASINPANERFVKASSIRHLVVMQSGVVDTALNGVCPQSVAIEINRDDVAYELLDDLCDDIARYVEGKSATVQKFIYDAKLLRKSEVAEEEFGNMRNFTLFKRRFYPILVGENSYQKQGYDYLGFKALKRRKFKV